MTMFRRLLSIMALLVLAACGGAVANKALELFDGPW